MAKVMGVSVEFIKAMEQKVDPSQLPQVGAAFCFVGSLDFGVHGVLGVEFFQRKHRKEV